MGTEWTSSVLSDFLHFQKGVSYQGKYLDKPGPKLLGLGTIKPGGGLNLDKARSYSGPIKDKQRIGVGELFLALTDITQEGRILGAPALIPKGLQGEFAVTHHVARAEIDKPKELDTRFLYYFLQSHDFHTFMRGMATGTTVRAVSPTDAESYDCFLPPYKEQIAIAHILGTLDDKIELNRRMNETLEAIARAIFKSWFVDFDPVRAKAEGRDTGLPKPIADLFPDRLVDSELGEIPEGWKPAAFSEIAEIVLGGTPRTSVPEYWNGPIWWAAAKDVTQADGIFVLETERTITSKGVESSNAKTMPKWTNVITARGTVGVQKLLGHEMAINQTSYALIPKSYFTPTFIYFRLGSSLRQLIARSYGTVFATITTKTFQNLFIPCPPQELVQAFEAIANPLLHRVLDLCLEAKTLATLRDTLLPKLISGEIRVSDSGGYQEVAV